MQSKIGEKFENKVQNLINFKENKVLFGPKNQAWAKSWGEN